MDVLCDAIDFTSPTAHTVQPEAFGVSQTSPSFSDSPQARVTPHSDGSHRCHLCGRTYERADHLNRHLKSHENARPHKCNQCSKSFNRADLLNRHQAGHDRNAGIRIERTDRVSTACAACIGSKTKCQDEKPCARCRRRNIPCEMAPSKAQKSSNSHKASRSRAENISSPAINFSIARDQNESQRIDPYASNGFSTEQYQGSERPVANGPRREIEHSNEIAGHDLATPNIGGSTGLLFDAPIQDFSFLIGGSDLNNSLGFMAPDPYFSQDLDFGIWDIDLDSVERAYESIDPGPSIQEASHFESARASNKPRDAAKRYAAFEKSPWLWTPTPKDQAMNDQHDLNLDEESIPSILSPSSPATSLDDFASCCINSKIRDQMLGLLFSLPKPPKGAPSFPSLSILNNIIQIYFVQESYRIDSLIHPASIVPSRVIPELYLAIVAQGSTLISTPAIWRMGLALQEVVRNTVVELWETNNSNTRNLQALQAFVISLDIGLWSGFKRKMELAESFGQPVIIMLRRAGAFAAPRQASLFLPERTDSEAVLESKWKKWAERESYKRLVLHLFIHDIHASIALQKPPLITFTELKFEPPASRELWLAKSATSWRDLYLSSQSASNAPGLIEAMHNPEALLQHSLQIDIQLATLTLLHGFWGQIHSLLESKKFYPASKATHRLCLLTTHTELYRDLASFSAALPSPSHRTILISHLFMMILHAAPEDLQRFAGKFGEDEARKASTEFQTWSETAEARVSVWHAGQVLRAADKLMPAQLRGFNAIAVYYAALTLWTYGLMSGLGTKSGLLGIGRKAEGGEVVLNEMDTSAVRDFRSSGDGMPGLRVVTEGREDFVALTSTDRILRMAREIYRNNFPVRDEGLPPLVENLGNLLRDLSELPGSRVSRAATEAPL